MEQYKEEFSLGRREAYLMKRVRPELTDPSKIVTQLDLWFPCWNKCGERVTDLNVICHLFNCLTAGTSTFPQVLTSSMKFTKEAARDLYLSVKIVKRIKNVEDEMSEDVQINIWSKVKLF